jgi:hypothetical protein
MGCIQWVFGVVFDLGEIAVFGESQVFDGVVG